LSQQASRNRSSWVMGRTYSHIELYHPFGSTIVPATAITTTGIDNVLSPRTVSPMVRNVLQSSVRSPLTGFAPCRRKCVCVLSSLMSRISRYVAEYQGTEHLTSAIPRAMRFVLDTAIEGISNWRGEMVLDRRICAE
jgi:hypothetical protein